MLNTGIPLRESAPCESDFAYFKALNQSAAATKGPSSRAAAVAKRTPCRAIVRQSMPAQPIQQESRRRPLY
eukprot:355873-Chlamydomonas_euryale.AAC.4